MLIRFPVGTEERIGAVLAPGEDRTGVIRDAVETEIRRREKAFRAKAKKLATE